MSAAFPPYPDRDQARDWLNRQLQWENLLAALRDAQRDDPAITQRRRREPAAA